MHGGTVTAASEGSGRGSRFTVALPLIVKPVARAPGAPAPRPHGRRVVVMEDHEDSRTARRHLLEVEGHEAHEAADGPSGVELVARLRPDIALVDLGLPGFDGYEVARRIRQVCGDSVQIVALTGYDLAEYRQQSREAGFDDHVVKPLTPEVLGRLLVGAAGRPGGRIDEESRGRVS